MADIPSTVWLEIDKNNKAILSYFDSYPKAPSSKCDYIEATTTELTILDALEDFIWPAGTVATLSDLEGIRERIHTARQAAATPAAKAPQPPTKAASGPASTTPPISNEKAKASLLATMRQLGKVKTKGSK